MLLLCTGGMQVMLVRIDARKSVRCRADTAAWSRPSRKARSKDKAEGRGKWKGKRPSLPICVASERESRRALQTALLRLQSGIAHEAVHVVLRTGL